MKPQSGLEVSEDVDGNPLVSPTGDSDVGRLVYLLEWARRRGFRIGPTVRVGTLILQVQDLRQDEGQRIAGNEPDPGPWRTAGHDGDD